MATKWLTGGACVPRGDTGQRDDLSLCKPEPGYTRFHMLLSIACNLQHMYTHTHNFISGISI